MIKNLTRPRIPQLLIVVCSKWYCSANQYVKAVGLSSTNQEIWIYLGDILVYQSLSYCRIDESRSSTEQLLIEIEDPVLFLLKRSIASTYCLAQKELPLSLRSL